LIISLSFAILGRQSFWDVLIMNTTNIKKVFSFMSFIIWPMCSAFYSGMMYQQYSSSRSQLFKLTQKLPAKYKMGDCLLQTFKTEFKESSYLYIVNQAGKEHYSMNAIHVNPNTNENYVVTHSIDEEEINEVDISNTDSLSSRSWKKVECPTYIASENGKEFL
jgi:hypothetical protein